MLNQIKALNRCAGSLLSNREMRSANTSLKRLVRKHRARRLTFLSLHCDYSIMYGAYRVFIRVHANHCKDGLLKREVPNRVKSENPDKKFTWGIYKNKLSKSRIAAWEQAKHDMHAFDYRLPNMTAGK